MDLQPHSTKPSSNAGEFPVDGVRALSLSIVWWLTVLFYFLRIKTLKLHHLLFILFKLRRCRHLQHWMIHQIYWHHYIQKGYEVLILVNWCTCTTKDNLKETTMLYQVRNLHFFQITTCIKKTSFCRYHV